jgi:hypothetical protein
VLPALLLLTADHVRRLLREGIVLRSLVFPVTLVLVAVMGTVAFVVQVKPPQVAALSPDVATPELVQGIEGDGFAVRVTPDPGAAVRDGTAVIGTDGATLWIGQHQPPPPLEERLRERLGASWRPHHPQQLRAAAIQGSDAPRQLAVFVCALFSLYGVVFGAGGIARDRDQGTLDAELSVALPHVVHGLARWLAGSVVLAGFYAVSVWALHAVMGVGDVNGIVLHGAAAAGAATAIGLLVIGRSGLDRGFAGPMSGGLVLVFGLLSAGLAGGVARVLPIASVLAHDASPWPPLALAATTGLLAAVVFARRTAVT